MKRVQLALLRLLAERAEGFENKQEDESPPVAAQGDVLPRRPASSSCPWR
jgi:hypothetical protein